MQRKKEKFFIIAFSVLFFISGCSTHLSQQALNVKDADFRSAENCKFIGDVHGSSGFGNLAASTRIQNAKNEAREQAASMGATHVIWDKVSGGYSPFVNGKAYICQ